ncbi:dipeptidyl aminopeptidase/acylaminoacyl peptidase [Gillisia mitskevichiae]|uniref:Dipeptidyl aminopeptidase/acylaminoacyl peptidase n=1 Tax=Gillisia mitskevichiae TaxID=270921 RepID=A0A495PYS0_9FLAO|nr:S9 family peptidase [Gillisia mitskevichiae]RKS55781.1 dipeptidyl aminopeptidase/acylaminoacyl peptidase [Gillisia mitskevichiae]
MNLKSSFSFLIISLLCIGLNAQETEKKVLTAEDYEQAAKFLPSNVYPLTDLATVRPNWLKNGNFWYVINKNSEAKYVLVDAKSGKKKESSDLTELLDDSERNKVVIQKPSINNYVLSPDGKKAAYIKDWNLWMMDLESEKEIQLTTDGIENFGYATDNAGWRKSDRPILLWSPDSKKISTYQQDQRHVSDMYLVSTNIGAPNLQSWKYPLPQDEDIIRIHRVIIEVDAPKVIRLQLPPDPRRGTLCDDISCEGSFDDNQWNADASKLVFVSTSRDHKIAGLRIADANTGEVRNIFAEEVETQYESGQGAINWRYLPKSKEVIWYSERDDWGHLYLYDLETGKLKHQITKGDFVVTQLLKIDEKTRKLYFLANGKENGRDPYFTHFYSVDFSGKNLKLLTPEDGNHSVNIAPESNYFVDTYSQPNVSPVSVLRDLNGKLISELEKADLSRLEAIGWKPATPIKVKSNDGKWDLYGLMFVPTDLDTSKKYPVVNYIYPGPQAGGVGSRSFAPARRDHQALAELGFIVVVIDGTCNPDRSKSFHDACYGNMADNTLKDQISGIKQLAEKFGYLDLDRVGIWGHSGGGFATASAMFNYPEFYKVGISESGNHDSRNYEDDWGERYIGLMKLDEEGNSNYDDQANAVLAKNLQGKLMLAHGGLDDNVPPYNTYLVVDALIKANKDFDLVIFPNARHGFGQDSNYMMRKRWDYFVTHLMGATPPKEFDFSAN